MQSLWQDRNLCQSDGPYAMAAPPGKERQTDGRILLPSLLHATVFIPEDQEGGIALSNELSAAEQQILDEIKTKIRDASKVNVSGTVGQLRHRRTTLQTPFKDDDQVPDADYDMGEYCYSLVSLLQESEKLINGEKFSSKYIEEKCFMLARYAKQIGEETRRDYDNG